MGPSDTATPDEASLRRELDDILSKKNRLDERYQYTRRELQDIQVEQDRLAKRIVLIRQQLNTYDVFVATRAKQSVLRDRRHESVEGRKNPD